MGILHILRSSSSVPFFFAPRFTKPIGSIALCVCASTLDQRCRHQGSLTAPSRSSWTPPAVPHNLFTPHRSQQGVVWGPRVKPAAFSLSGERSHLDHSDHEATPTSAAFEKRIRRQRDIVSGALHIKHKPPLVQNAII